MRHVKDPSTSLHDVMAKLAAALDTESALRRHFEADTPVDEMMEKLASALEVSARIEEGRKRPKSRASATASPDVASAGSPQPQPLAVASMRTTSAESLCAASCAGTSTDTVRPTAQPATDRLIGHIYNEKKWAHLLSVAGLAPHSMPGSEPKFDGGDDTQLVVTMPIPRADDDMSDVDDDDVDDEARLAAGLASACGIEVPPSLRFESDERGSALPDGPHTHESVRAWGESVMRAVEAVLLAFVRAEPAAFADVDVFVYLLAPQLDGIARETLWSMKMFNGITLATSPTVSLMEAVPPGGRKRRALVLVDYAAADEENPDAALLLSAFRDF
jgi:hypothetical protein